MNSDELQGEIAGILGRLSVKMRTDPMMARALLRGTQDTELILDGIEEAIIGLVLLHINVRRGIR